MNAESKTSKAERAKTPAWPAGMAILDGGMLEAYLRAGQAVVANAFAMNQEMLQFAGKRFQADVEALQALPRLNKPEDLLNFQTDFLRSAATAYQAEMSKLMEQNTKAATDIWQTVLERSAGAAAE